MCHGRDRVTPTDHDADLLSAVALRYGVASQRNAITGVPPVVSARELRSWQARSRRPSASKRSTKALARAFGWWDMPSPF